MTQTSTLLSPEVPAQTLPANKLLVFLHGLGSDGHDLIDLAPYMQQTLPNIHFVSPHGVERYDMAPFGYQWFSLLDRQEHIIMPQLERNAPLVSRLIDLKCQEMGLQTTDVFLFGFSQGAMLGSYLTLSNSESYAGMISCSGRLLLPKVVQNKNTPFCLVHGLEDDVVPSEETEKLAQYLHQKAIACQKLLIPHLGHSIDGSGLNFAVKFIKAILNEQPL